MLISALATKAQDEGWLLELRSRSVAAGSPLVVEANRSLTGVSIHVARVQEHEDMWALSAGLEADPEQPNVGRCQAVGDQLPGLYWLTALDITKGPQMAATRVPVQPRLLFEIRAASDQARSLEELEAAAARAMADGVSSVNLTNTAVGRQSPGLRHVEI